MKILYQGHGSLRLITNSNTVLYLDPCAGKGYDVPADVILVTHQHGDHNQIAMPVRGSNCVVIQNSDALVDGSYKSFQVGDLVIEAVPAYNRNHDRDECVGYLVSADGILCYFSGDTSKIKEMKDLTARKIDYAFFATDGVYNMDVSEAAECAVIVGARHSTPIHIMPFHGETGDLFSDEKAARFSPPGRLIMHPGEEIRAE
jgi:L-ascorbate metabolism protein UlaG (beta-lactamase superfamily)